MNTSHKQEEIEQFINAIEAFKLALGQAILESWMGRKVARVLLWLETLYSQEAG